MIDLQTYMNNAMAAQRAAVLAKSPQLTLGELILKLKPIVDRYANEKPEDQPRVIFDFGTAFPTHLGSWRGSYSELALGYALSGHDASHFGETKASDLLKELESAVGNTYTGWKGGDFVMNKNTPVWVANPGNAGNTAIVEVVDNEYEVILMTQYCEY